jgi:hypothetical protein
MRRQRAGDVPVARLTARAKTALDSHGQALLEHEILALLERCNTAHGASLVLPSEYLDAVIVKRSP